MHARGSQSLKCTNTDTTLWRDYKTVNTGNKFSAGVRNTYDLCSFLMFLFFCFSFFSFFPAFSFSFSDRRQNRKKHYREVLTIKMKTFLCEKSFLGPSMDRGFGMDHVRVTPAFMFFISFFHFSFLSCTSFKYVSLLAFVSKFDKRCFLYNRCSMVMWCLDDTGRDSWDWVGPPTQERA